MNRIEDYDRLARVAGAQAKEIERQAAEIVALQKELDSTVKTGLGILEENKRLRAEQKAVTLTIAQIATGRYLDLLGAEFGLTRDPAEPDETFRTRVVAAIRNAN